MGTDILDELEWRGLIAQSTDRDALRRELADGVLTHGPSVTGATPTD